MRILPRPGRRLSLSFWLVLLAGVGMLARGHPATHEVRTEDADELADLLGFAPFEPISEYQLIIDATFTGVARRDGHLYSTYDRAAPPQKRACPT